MTFIVPFWPHNSGIHHGNKTLENATVRDGAGLPAWCSLHSQENQCSSHDSLVSDEILSHPSLRVCNPEPTIQAHRGFNASRDRASANAEISVVLNGLSPWGLDLGFAPGAQRPATPLRGPSAEPNSFSSGGSKPTEDLFRSPARRLVMSLNTRRKRL